MVKQGALINGRSLNKFLNSLAQDYQKACAKTVPLIQELTPVDTKRLYNSTRAETVVSSGNIVQCNFVAGGVSLPGELREQGIERNVNYAYWVEIRNPYIRPNLPSIGRELIVQLQRIRAARKVGKQGNL
jgi:hypothetical protein